MTCPVQNLYHHPLESQQECPKDQPDLLRQCNLYKEVSISYSMKEQFNCMFWKVLLILSPRHHDKDFFYSNLIKCLCCLVYICFTRSLLDFFLSFFHVLFGTLSVILQCVLVTFFLHFILYKQITWVKSW